MRAIRQQCLCTRDFRTGQVQEVIEHGHNGLLVDFFDHQALADTLADALERRAELQALREAARQTVVPRHDLQRVCLPAMLAFAHGGLAKAQGAAVLDDPLPNLSRAAAHGHAASARFLLGQRDALTAP
jgi:hypothetical protein